MKIGTSARVAVLAWLFGSALNASADPALPVAAPVPSPAESSTHTPPSSAAPRAERAAPAAAPAPAVATLQEVLPGLWVGGAVPVAQMPGWPTADADAGAGARKLFTIIDLRSPAESPDVGAERAAAAAAGVGYLSIPVSRTGAPPASATAQLAAVLANAEGAPVVLHCVSGNRAGDLLARYLIRTGMDVDSAIAKGREVGLSPQREAAIRGGALGHP